VSNNLITLGGMINTLPEMIDRIQSRHRLSQVFHEMVLIYKREERLAIESLSLDSHFLSININMADFTITKT
jgi:hypothetical protein